MPTVDEKTLESELRSIISEIVEVDPKRITQDANFVEDLGMDSMMALEILASVEKKFKIKIPEDNLAKMINLRQVANLVNSYL